MAATPTRDDLMGLARSMRMDATAIQAKLTDLFSLLNQLDLPEEPAPFSCVQASCGLPFLTESTLDDHLANVHGIETDAYKVRLSVVGEDAVR